MPVLHSEISVEGARLREIRRWLCCHTEFLFYFTALSFRLYLFVSFVFDQVDMLTEIAHPPKIMTNVPTMITPEQFKKDLDSYLKTRSPVTFLSELRTRLQVTKLCVPHTADRIYYK